MKEIAKAFIEKRVQQTRTDHSDNVAELILNFLGKTRSELARNEAQRGYPETTASCLLGDDTLSVSQKGEILAKAFKKSAERSESYADRFDSPSIKEKYQVEARQSNEIAQGLTRATIFQRLTELKNVRGRLKRAAKKTPNS